MESWKKSLLVLVLFIIILEITCVLGHTQFFWGPYLNYLGPSWIGSAFYPNLYPFRIQYSGIPSLYGVYQGWGNPLSPFIRTVPTVLAPYQRSPNATIIFTSPTLTAVTTTPGVIVIGNTAAFASPTVVATSAPVAVTAASPAPAPLFSILSILYASALYAPAPLSTANPLLFALLQTLLL